MGRDPSTCRQREGRAIVYDRWHGDDQVVLRFFLPIPLGHLFLAILMGHRALVDTAAARDSGDSSVNCVAMVSGRRCGRRRHRLDELDYRGGKLKITQLVVAIHRLVLSAHVGVVFPRSASPLLSYPRDPIIGPTRYYSAVLVPLKRAKEGVKISGFLIRDRFGSKGKSSYLADQLKTASFSHANSLCVVALGCHTSVSTPPRLTAFFAISRRR
jgi:hypothetical protein